MAYPLYTPDLLAAWQSRFQREQQGEADQANAGQRRIQEQMAAEQLKSLQAANKKSQLEMDLMTSPFNVQDFSRPGSSSPGIGYDKYASDQEKLRTLSMLTGNPMPSQGIRGGYGGGGGSESMSGENEPGSYNTYGQNEATRQGELSQANTDLAEAQAKGAGLKASGYGSATADLMAQQQVENQTRAIQDKYPAPTTPEASAALEYQLGQAGTEPVNKILAQREGAAQRVEKTIGAAAEKEAKTLKQEKEKERNRSYKYQREVNKNKTLNEITDTNIRAKIKNEILEKLEAIVAGNDAIGRETDIEDIVLSYKKKYGL